MATDLPYRYFVSFSYSGGFGCIAVSLPALVDAWEEIENLRALAATTQTTSKVGPPVLAGEVVILNFILLAGPEEAAK